nr:lectin-like protein [uncultured Mediterranean phage uvMED]
MANTYIKRDLSVSETVYKFTWSAWVKRSQITAHNTLFKSRTDGNNWCQCYFESDDRLILSSYKNGGYHYIFKTNRLFRDTNAFYHVMVNVDSSQSTAGDRVRIYVNGERETSFNTATNNLSNGDSLIINSSDSGTGHTIGSWNTSNYLDGVLSHVHYSSGYSYAPTVFGSQDATTGEWKINTSPSFTLGGNGYTVLKDGITITDQSSNSNDFTLGGGTLTKTEDCPSNVFATMNPLDNQIASSTFSNGNNTIVTNQSNYTWNTGTLGMTSGKFYWEVKYSANSNSDLYNLIGIADRPTDGNTDILGRQTDCSNYGYYSDTGQSYAKNVLTSYGNTYGVGDIIGVAVDLDNSKLYFSKNGTWQNSGVPTSGSTGTGAISIDAISSTTTGVYFPASGDYGSSQYVTNQHNFGNGYFGTTAVATNSGNGYAGAEGSSIFNYQPPTGYSALSTKGLNQ